MTTLVLLVPLVVNAAIIAIIWEQLCNYDPEAELRRQAA